MHSLKHINRIEPQKRKGLFIFLCTPLRATIVALRLCGSLSFTLLPALQHARFRRSLL